MDSFSVESSDHQSQAMDIIQKENFNQSYIDLKIRIKLAKIMNQESDSISEDPSDQVPACIPSVDLEKGLAISFVPKG